MTIRIDVKLKVCQQTADTIARLGSERGLSRQALVLQALGVLQVAHDAAKEGYYHGLTRDRENLETVLVAPI